MRLISDAKAALSGDRASVRPSPAIRKLRSFLACKERVQETLYHLHGWIERPSQRRTQLHSHLARVRDLPRHYEDSRGEDAERLCKYEHSLRSRIVDVGQEVLPHGFLVGTEVVDLRLEDVHGTRLPPRSTASSRMSTS